MAELARRRIKVLEDKGKQSFKTAMKADLVIAGSAVCASWIGENHFKKFHQHVKLVRCLQSPRVISILSNGAQGLGETFGRVTFEVMAFGLPVLGTEARGTKEIVEHNVTGLLHPVGHDGTRGLAENLRFLLKMCAIKAFHLTIDVDALKAEVTNLRAEGEQMKAQLRAQGEEMKTCLGRVQELVQAIQMFGLQISLPAPHLAPPSTLKPSGPANPNSLMY
ncbi:hypothetical protein DVH24_013544 [Malus domestica]|uniref:Glycosyl transferase family 1 domain-containing protein n=1 Tax=Malus domestica TaxID=3750 RepID=A0A498HH29_MALDO|nr:hypothetical protein DVH24_013544 [Malus domestica]